MTALSAPQPPSTRALAWDPTAPASLSLFPPNGVPTTNTLTPSKTSTPNTNSTPGKNGEQSLDIFLSHDGTGIDDVETTCLLSLLDATDAWQKKPHGRDVEELSASYRRSLCECLMGLLQKHSRGNENGNDNYESLALIYAMIHLNEIYLLPHPISRRGVRNKLDGPPGSLTANTIRYLRLHHSSFDLDSSAVQRLLEMDQPEYYNGDEEMTSDPMLSGPFSPYYNLLLHLIRLGQLNSAWAVMTRHSSCRRATEEANRGTLSKEAEGWAALRCALLSAPIPGGRGDEDDSGLVDDVVGDADQDYNERYMNVSRSAHCLWEANPRNASRERRERHNRQLLEVGLDLPREDVEVLPEVYSEGVAMHSFAMWQREVRGMMSPGRMGGEFVFKALFLRFPPLQQILSLLTGGENNSNLDASWSEALIAELLYSRPNISPADIAVRARVAMRHCGSSNEGWESIILNVMEGSVGDVVQSVFEFGGGSGAALPATLTSLLCNLLMDAGCITLPVLETELLLAAAEAILSSFSIQGQSDIGVCTAVRFLLPHSPPKRIGEDIHYEPRIAATISLAISHRCPSTDGEAHNVLTLTEEMIRLGSIRIADACESLAFCRASHHASQSNWSRQVYWLLRGMEIMSDWLPEDYRRTLGFACRRHFDVLCEKSADELLSLLVATRCFPGEGEEEKLTEKTTAAFRKASSVLEAVLKDGSITTIMKSHVEVSLLYHVVNIAVSQAKEDRAETSKHIISCLEERCMKDGGEAVTTLANSTMYLRLIQLAISMLDEEDGPMSASTCAFSAHGVHILMARMTQVLGWEGVTCPNSSLKPTEERVKYLTAMRLVLCKGLARAFASNSGKAKENEVVKKKLTLEEEVALMLRPTI